MASLSERVLSGEVRAAARLMRDLDDRLPEGEQALRELFPRTGRAYVVGLTGSPGAGKSSLTDRLIAHLRRAGASFVEDIAAGVRRMRLEVEEALCELVTAGLVTWVNR